MPSACNTAYKTKVNDKIEICHILSNKKLILKHKVILFRPELCTSQLRGLLSIEFESRKCDVILPQQFLPLYFARKLLSRFQQPS